MKLCRLLLFRHN